MLVRRKRAAPGAVGPRRAPLLGVLFEGSEQGEQRRQRDDGEGGGEDQFGGEDAAHGRSQTKL